MLSLVRGREDHLANMLVGLERQSLPPDEVIIALMQDEIPEFLKDFSLPVRTVKVTGGKLPLAKARNAAADAAQGELLIFLDVDCIPHPGFVEAASEAIEDGRVLMGDCRYLDAETPGHLPFEELWQKAERHPARLGGELAGAPVAVSDMSEFWSLVFALERNLYERSGGFDETFEGYGGEDTDFALALGKAGGALTFVPAMRAVHQWHPVSKPPLQHFADVITNAERFRRKHGRWCMEYWLEQFEREGYIAWTEDRVEVLRQPSDDDFERARAPRTVRFS